MLVAGLAVVLAAMVTTVTVIVSDFHLVVGRIDHASTAAGTGTIAVGTAPAP